MKKLLSLVITAVFLVLVVGTALPLAPTAVAQQAKVGAQFSTYLIYDSPEDTFTNGKVTGRKEWHANLGTGEPLPGLALTLDSSLNFDHIMKDKLTTTGPPTYVWSFGDVPAATVTDVYVGFGSLDSPGIAPVTFTPGFDASRSFDKAVFTAPDTQTLTITVTPREVTEQLGILIFADENDQVNPVITSPTSGDGIELSKDGHKLGISPARLALNTTWTITVTIQVTPKVPKVEYMPFVGIGWREPVASSTASGNSLSLPVADMGTWTVSAEGSYEWEWTDELIRQVCWRSNSKIVGEEPEPAYTLKGNHVRVDFLDTFFPSGSEDSFTNHEVSSTGRLWRIATIENIKDKKTIKDEMGEPVRGLRVTLDSDLAFDWVSGWGTLTTKRGPPTYEWFFGDLSEDYTGHPKDANVGFTGGEPTKYTPGFDVSRSFDRTVFDAPGTQTMTITMTRREESFETALIYVVAETNTDLVDADIISVSADCPSEIDPSGYYASCETTTELDTPLTLSATIRVTPKVPEVVYKPRVGVKANYPQELYHNIVEGSSFSYTNKAGTWTVSAEGSYVWNWSCPAGSPRPDVISLNPIATPPMLISAGISPPSGTPKTDFTFEVGYRDLDRKPPSYIRVYIDGSAYDMGHVIGNVPEYYAGCVLYSYTTTLRPGRHAYYFEASDVSGLTARFPETGTLSIEVSREGQEPVPASGQAISWQVIIYITAGIVIIGSVAYFFVRRRGRRVR